MNKNQRWAFFVFEETENNRLTPMQNRKKDYGNRGIELYNRLCVCVCFEIQHCWILKSIVPVMLFSLFSFSLLLSSIKCREYFADSQEFRFIFESLWTKIKRTSRSSSSELKPHNIIAAAEHSVIFRLTLVNMRL